MCIDMYTQIDMCLYIYTYICLYMYVYIYTYMAGPSSWAGWSWSRHQEWTKAQILASHYIWPVPNLNVPIHIYIYIYITYAYIYIYECILVYI